MIVDSTHYTEQQKLNFRKELFQIGKKEGIKLQNMMKIDKEFYINTQTRVFWSIYYDKKENISYIKIY